MSYNELCALLGIRNDIGFVTYRRGVVGFSCGKPEEVRALAAACRRHNLKMTRGLARAAAR